jgi:hypothetical protein
MNKAAAIIRVAREMGEMAAQKPKNYFADLFDATYVASAEFEADNIRNHAAAIAQMAKYISKISAMTEAEYNAHIVAENARIG